MCTACFLPNTITNYVDIIARGLCQRTKFDTRYQVQNDKKGYVMYLGEKHTTITYDPEEKKWTMLRINKPEVYAERGAISNHIKISFFYHFKTALRLSKWPKS